MPDKRTYLLLEKILSLCDGGGYKIVEESELLSCFPVKLQTDAEGLAHMVRYLSEHRLIDVKYAEQGVYCLAPLPEGRMLEEQTKSGRTETVRRRVSVLLFTALGAFLGAFFGAWLAMLAAAGAS